MIAQISCFEDGKQINKKVKSNQVKIEGFDKFSFCSHKTSFPKNVRWLEGDGYTVTELSTGLSIATGGDEQMAINNAKRVLKKKGVRKVTQQIKDFKDGTYNPHKNKA